MSRRLASSQAALGLGLMLASAGSLAAAFKVTLISVADDPRLDRNRVERAYFGHPTGPAADGVQVALKEAKLEMDAVGTDVLLETVAVASADAARAAATTPRW